MWSIWDKKTDINGVPAERALTVNFNHLANEKTIFIYTVDGEVSRIEGKSILANKYGIDPDLPDDEFIAVYEAMTADPSPETDTTTYAELAQVYAEGVNSIE